MNVGNVPYQAFPSIGYAISAAGDGRMSLPVSPSQVIYSHFKHVSGTPAPEGTMGVNISRLKILNTLIDQLERMKGQSATELGTLTEHDENRINALIDQYQKQIKSAQSVSVYTPAAPATGALFNIAA
jgi:F0F1-type ATP synthase epsilon subunit